TFTTDACAPPTVVTGAASGIGAFGATLNGTANPNGTSTNANFEYGLTTGYGSTTSSQPLGSGNVAVAIGGGAITGLACNTPYHFRAVATNTGGTTNGSDATFTTGACAPTRVISLSGNLAFGDVHVGSTSTSTLTISNSGNTTLTVSSITYPSGFSGDWAGGTIAAGASQAVTITFAPVAATTYVGTLVVNADQ